MSGRILVGKRERLLFRKAELVGFLVVSNVATCGLRTQPFADVAFIGARLCGQFSGSHWFSGQRFIKPQFLADYHHARVYSRAKIADEAAKEGIQFFHVNRSHVCSS
jgi:hypothetical protein